MNLQIDKLTKKDINKTLELMKATIIDSFLEFKESVEKNKFENLVEGEVNTQKQRLEMDPELNFPCFYIARNEEEIVGVIGYGPRGKTVEDALQKLNQKEEGMVEVFSAYVSPSLQRQGIGSRLLKTLLDDLKNMSHQHYALYTGYTKGKSFWTNRLGNPSVILKNYFPGNVDCWVWIRVVNFRKIG